MDNYHINNIEIVVIWWQGLCRELVFSCVRPVSVLFIFTCQLLFVSLQAFFVGQQRR